MRVIACVLLAAFAGSATIPLAASAQQAPTVMIDGSPMTFTDQPPVVRAGRIYVPMRAIFERLGATVVYDRGTINATHHGRTVQLQIGSPVATVDGGQVQLDAPPFEIASRTLVPLRFVSQSLGAHVSWDQNRDTAYIMTAAGSGAYSGGPTDNGPPPSQGTHVLLHRPQPWSATSDHHTPITAEFLVPLRPDSVRIQLDGQDVTQDAQVTATGFSLTLPARLESGMHTVTVFGMTHEGRRLRDGWSFRVL